MQQLVMLLTAMQPMLAAFVTSYTSTTTVPTVNVPPVPTPPVPPPVSWLPKGVKPPQPNRFDARNKADIPAWIDQTRATLLLAGFSLESPATVAYVSSFLDDRAAAWWSTCVSAAPPHLKASAGFSGFEEFAIALRDRLGVPHADDFARDRLSRLRQHKSVLDYTDEFTRLIKEIPNRHPSDLRHDYLQGLKAPIRGMLVQKISHDSTWQEISKLAHECDNVLMADRRSRSAYPSSASAALYPRPAGPADPMDLGNLNTSTSRSSSRPPTPSRSSRPGHRSSSPFPRPSRSSLSPASSSSSARLSKLTDAERAYLRANHGCFRCRQINADHVARECPRLSSNASASQPARSGPAVAASRSSSPSPRPKN
jgi:hypothetical protein